MEKTGNVNARKQYETAICLARMYGVRETLEPFPFIENSVIVDTMLKWSEEYLSSGSDDLLRFFLDKCQSFIGKGETENEG